jgi:hypothetical protein
VAKVNASVHLPRPLTLYPELSGCVCIYYYYNTGHSPNDSLQISHHKDNIYIYMSRITVRTHLCIAPQFGHIGRRSTLIWWQVNILGKNEVTVPAPISGSFVFGTRTPGTPTIPLLSTTTAQERLTGAPRSSPSHRRVEIVVTFVATMLIGATRRSNGDNRVWRRQPTFFERASRASSESRSRPTWTTARR